MPLLEARPQSLDDVAVAVDPVGAGDRRLVALGRHPRTRTGVPDVVAEAMAGIAAVAHHPLGHAGQLAEEWDGVRQFVRLSRRDAKADGAASSVCDHAGLGAIAATRPAKSFTSVSLGCRSPLFAAPAAFW